GVPVTLQGRRPLWGRHRVGCVSVRVAAVAERVGHVHCLCEVTLQARDQCVGLFLLQLAVCHQFVESGGRVRDGSVNNGGGVGVVLRRNLAQRLATAQFFQQVALRQVGLFGGFPDQHTERRALQQPRPPI